jgi:anti-anti-sigma factor
VIRFGPVTAIEVREAPLAGAPGVSVIGEIDAATAPILEEAVESRILATHGAFVIDLGEVPFLDSGGANVLLRARALLGREDRELVLVCPPGPVLHVLETLRIADVFALFASRSAAARSLVRSAG